MRVKLFPNFTRHHLITHTYTCEFLELSNLFLLISETGLCEEYQVPYFDMLPGDPSFDEVKKVVLTEKKRPLVPNRWNRDEVKVIDQN